MSQRTRSRNSLICRYLKIELNLIHDTLEASYDTQLQKKESNYEQYLTIYVKASCDKFMNDADQR